MDFIEFSRSEILVLSNILRLVRQETGMPLKMQSENFLTRLNTAIYACKNPKTHTLYQEFIASFSQPELLVELGIIQPRSSEEVKKTVYRGQEHSQAKPVEKEPEQDKSAPAGKKKIVYRGQVKWVDK